MKLSANQRHVLINLYTGVVSQGDPPNDLCIIVEGNVNIVKELVIVCKNRWPVGLREWKERTKKIHKPILLKQLGV